MPVQRAEAGSRPAASVFLLLRQKKGTKEKATLHAASLRFAAGNLRCSCVGCAAELTSRLRRCVQTTAASQFTKRVCPAAHAPPPALRSSAHPEGRGSRTSTRAVAALGPACAARGACARERWPSNAMARVPVRLFTPCWLRLRRGGCGVRMGVAAPMPRCLARRSCVNGAPKARSKFCGAPHNRPAAGLPLRNAKGSQTGGRLFFGAFLLAKQKKDTRRRATPGLRPSTKHAAYQRACEQRPGFDKLSPNGWEWNRKPWFRQTSTRTDEG